MLARVLAVIVYPSVRPSVTGALNNVLASGITGDMGYFIYYVAVRVTLTRGQLCTNIDYKL